MTKTVLIRIQPPGGQTTVYHLNDQEREIDRVSKSSRLGMDERVRGTIKDELSKGNRHFVVDLTSVKYLNSSSLGVILAWRQIVGEAEGELALANPNHRIKELVKHLRLEAIMKVFDSLPDAQRYFADSTE